MIPRLEILNEMAQIFPQGLQYSGTAKASHGCRIQLINQILREGR